MNKKNARVNALPGLLKKSGPPSNPSISDSVNRGNINSNIRILSDKEVKKKDKPKTDGHGNELKKYVPGVDGPKVIGGSAPNPAKAAYQLGKTLMKGGKYIYNKIKN
tara:strand:+ start:711 stop:1031 length:321 start_codon:yes stop_codon:yes gene_type:complete